MAEFELVADGLRFPEGPVVMPDGSVILVEIAEGQITPRARRRKQDSHCKAGRRTKWLGDWPGW